ncbi:MAG TPA: response regulator [Rhizomicrobium sp.]|nr:response regulator [Rhizomicrobium sp.]
MSTKEQIVIVDDDCDFRDSLKDLLDVSGFTVIAYDTAQHLLEVSHPDATCLIADIRMPGMDGLELQKELNARGSTLPVIIMTGHGDVPLAVRAMRAGAVDFLEKPFELPVLLDSIDRARQQHSREAEKSNEMRRALDKIALLTEREKEVFDLLVVGHQNKVIANKLDISPRTVEVHRSRIIEKTGAKGLPDLVHLAIAAGRDQD